MISLTEPTRTVGSNWKASYVITGHIVTALHGTAEFRSGNHSLLMGEGREDIQWRYLEESETSLGNYRAAISNLDAWRMGRIQRMGAWLSVLP